MSANPEIELIIFDIAGTLVDDSGIEQKCMRVALASAGVKVQRKDINRLHGFPKTEAIKRLVLEFDINRKVADRWQDVYADFSSWMHRCLQMDSTVREFDGVEEVFRQVKNAGFGVALTSNLNRDLVEDLLDRFGWMRTGLIDAVVASDEVERGRPYPDMIHRAMKLVGVASARQVLKVGDTPEDLLSARSADCGLIFGVASGIHSREQLQRFPHDEVLGSVTELPNRISFRRLAHPSLVSHRNPAIKIA